jgi:hypothetical protein
MTYFSFLCDIKGTLRVIFPMTQLTTIWTFELDINQFSCFFNLISNRLLSTTTFPPKFYTTET